MILLRGWEPPGYRRGYSRKGHLPCVRGRCTSSRWGGSGSVHVCWFMCVLGKYPVCFQFYRTKCQSRKLRHVIFWNICIKNPNLRKFFLCLPCFIRRFRGKNSPYPTVRAWRVLSLFVGCLVKLNSVAACYYVVFVGAIPHKVDVTVCGAPAQTISFYERPNHHIAAATSAQHLYSLQSPCASLLHPETQYRNQPKQPQPRQNQIQNQPETSNEPPESYP